MIDFIKSLEHFEPLKDLETKWPKFRVKAVFNLTPFRALRQTSQKHKEPLNPHH